MGYLRRRLSARGPSSATELVPHWYDGLSVGNFSNATDWQELSGLATAFKSGNENYFWVLSDAPANMLAAVLKSNASNQGIWTLESPPTYVDWEDLSSSVVDGVSYLYIFDFGNNGNGTNSRGSGIDMRIFRAVEPTITGSDGEIGLADYIEIDCVFPGVNGPTLRDCESAFIDPDNGKIYIITKRDATQRVYSLDHAATYTGTQTLVYEGTMTSLPSVTTVALTTTPCYAVSACINPDGTEILVKNYNNVYFFPRNKATQTIIQALQQDLVDVPAYVGGGSVSPKKSHPTAEPQGEGLCFSKDGRDFYSNSEYVSTEGSSSTRYPFFKYTRSAKAPSTIIFQDGLTVNGATYTGTSSTYIWQTNPNTDRSAETTFVVDTTVGTPTDDRRGLLKFDLSAIPTTATVIGCKLELWISAEGQGWQWFKMLVPWVPTSTHTSLGGVSNDGVKAEVTALTTNGINLDTILNVTARDNIPVSVVQAWVSSPSTNYGLLAMGLDVAGGDGVQFDGKASTTAARRPKLTVRYTT